MIIMRRRSSAPSCKCRSPGSPFERDAGGGEGESERQEGGAAASQRDPNPKDNSLTRREPSTYDKGLHSTSAALSSYQSIVVRVRAPLFAARRRQDSTPQCYIQDMIKYTIMYYNIMYYNILYYNISYHIVHYITIITIIKTIILIIITLLYWQEGGARTQRPSACGPSRPASSRRLPAVSGLRRKQTDNDNEDDNLVNTSSRLTKLLV